MVTCVNPDDEWPAVDMRRYPPLPQASRLGDHVVKVLWAFSQEHGPIPLHTIVWRSGLDYDEVRAALTFGYARRLIRTFEYGRYALYERVRKREYTDEAPPAEQYKAAKARQPNKAQRAKTARTAPTLPLLPEMA